jgi:hypothetical protein
VLIDIIAENDYPWNKKTTTFTTTSSVPEYILNHRVSGKQIYKIFDETNNREVCEKDLIDFYQEDPTPTETGTPYKWAFVCQSEVQNITTAAGVVSVSSSSASDTNITLIVRGKVSGVERIESLTLNGTSTVTGTLSFDADGIESVCLGSYPVGIVTVLQGAQTLSVLPPGYLRIQAPRIRLSYVPGGTYTLRYFYFQKAQRPSSPYDIIDIPDEGFRCLRKGIEAIAHMNNGDIDFAATAERDYEALKKKFYIWSVRNLNKKEVKGYVSSQQGFLARMPDSIVGNITA